LALSTSREWTAGTARPRGGPRPFGYLFQDPDHQIFEATVADEIAFGPRNLGLDAETARQRVQRAARSQGLLDKLTCDPFTLTKGERQKVALASVLATQPPVIVFDEPTTGLDGEGQRAMLEQLRHLNETGRTVIVITHSPWVAAEYCQRTVVMGNGEVLADAPTREVFGKRRTPGRCRSRGAGSHPPGSAGVGQAGPVCARAAAVPQGR